MANDNDFDVIFRIKLKETSDKKSLEEDKFTIKVRRSRGDSHETVDVKEYKKYRKRELLGQLDYHMHYFPSTLGLYEFQCPGQWRFRTPAFKFHEPNLYVPIENSGKKASFIAYASGVNVEIDHKFDLLVIGPDEKWVNIDPIIRNGSQRPLVEPFFLR